jgi:hypothetical protein
MSINPFPKTEGKRSWDKPSDRRGLIQGVQQEPSLQKYIQFDPF